MFGDLSGKKDDRLISDDSSQNEFMPNANQHIPILGNEHEPFLEGDSISQSGAEQTSEHSFDDFSIPLIAETQNTNLQVNQSYYDPLIKPKELHVSIQLPIEQKETRQSEGDEYIQRQVDERENSPQLYENDNQNQQSFEKRRNTPQLTEEQTEYPLDEEICGTSENYEQSDPLATFRNNLEIEQSSNYQEDNNPDRHDQLSETKYDKVITGWDPVPQLAGHKRPHSPETQTITTRAGRQVKKLNYHRLHHGMAIRPYADPKTWEEAMVSAEAPQWRLAVNEKIKSLQSTGTIEIVKRSCMLKGRSPMKCKWVFKKNFLANGNVDKWRARCTAKGFTQRPGIDFQETFAPTPRPGTGRIMLFLAHQLGWHRRQGDVPTTFLNPDLNIKLYMELPKGLEKQDHVILLRKSLYGLKQAAALWYDNARATLAELGLFPTISDICLYTNSQKDLFVLLYVDDFQVMGPYLAKIDSLMHALHSKYKLKTVDMNIFLGIQISYPEKDRLQLTQGLYARTLIERHGLKDCKTANTPIEHLLEPSGSNYLSQHKTEYNSVIGGLQYLANNMRPDIAFAINHLARFLANPAHEHLQASRRILR